MSELTRLCGLWRRTGQRGRVTYWTGRLTPTSRVVIFENTRKSTDRDPDFHLFIRTEEPKAKQPDPAPSTTDHDPDDASAF